MSSPKAKKKKNPPLNPNWKAKFGNFKLDLSKVKEAEAAFQKAQQEAETALAMAQQRMEKLPAMPAIDPGPAGVKLAEARKAIDALKLQPSARPDEFKKVMAVIDEAGNLLSTLESRAQALKTVFDEWNKARDEAAGLQEKAASLQASNPCPAVQTPVQAIADALGNADTTASTAMDEKAYRSAIAALSGVAGEFTKAELAATEATSAFATLREVQAGLAGFAKFKFIDTQPAQTLLDQGGTALTTAKDVNAIKAAAKTLEQAKAQTTKLQEDHAVFMSAYRSTEAQLNKVRDLLQTLQGYSDYGPLAKQYSTLMLQSGAALQDLAAAKTESAVRDLAIRAEQLMKRSDTAKALSKEGASIVAELGKAQDKITKVESLGYVDVSRAKELVATAANGVREAAELSAAQAAVKPLGGLDDLLKKLEKEAKPIGKARDKYLEARRQAVTQLSQVLRLDGASEGFGVPVEPRIAEIVKEMESALELAAKKAAPATKNAFEEARGYLEGFTSARVKEAEKASAKVTQQVNGDIKARADYDKAMLEAETARAKIAALPGQKEFLAQVGLLIQSCRIEPKGLLTFGHAGMVAKLNDSKTGYAALVKLAETAEKDRVKKANYDKEVIKAHEEFEKVLLNSAAKDKLLSEGVYLDFTRRLAEAKELANTKDQNDTQKAEGKAAALKGIEEVKKDFTEAKSAAAKSKQNVEALLEKVKNDLAGIKQITPSDVGAGVEAEVATIRDVDIAANAWDAAETRANRLATRLKNDLDRHKTAQAEWKKKVDALKKRINVVNVLLDAWPERGSLAKEIKGEAQVLLPRVESQFDYAAGIREADELIARFEELEKKYKDSVGFAFDPAASGIDAEKDPQAAEEAERTKWQEQLKGTKTVRAKYEKKAADAIAKSEQLLADFASKNLKDLRSWGALDVVKNQKEAIRAWQAFLYAPKVPSGETAEKEFEKQYAALTKALEAATKEFQDLAGKPDKLKAAVQTVKDADNALDDANRAVIVDGKLDKLVALGGDRDPFLRGDNTPFANRQPPHPIDDLRKLEGYIDQVIAKLGTQMETDVKEGTADLQKFAKRVAEKKGSGKDYDRFYDEVRDEAGDLIALLESRDPGIVESAKRKIEALKEKFENAINPEKDEPSFSSIDKLFQKITDLLAGEKINARLPQTVEGLKKEAGNLRARAYALPPAEARYLVEPFLQECEDKADQARKLQAEFDRFKDMMKRTSEMLDRLTANTSTRKKASKVGTALGGSTAVNFPALVGNFQAQLAQTKQLAKTEDGIPKAVLDLAELTRKLEEIDSAPDSNEAMLRADAKARREQDAVMNLCKQYLALKQAFRTEYKETEKAVKGKYGPLRFKTEFDKSQLVELQRLQDTANHAVKPYLELYANLTNPERDVWDPKIQRDDPRRSPPITEVLPKFTQAQSMLNRAIEGAKRIAANPDGTTVKVTGDFEQVEKDWRDRAGRFAKALTTFAAEIRTAVDDDPHKDEIEEAVKKLLARLRSYPGKFPVNVFRGSFATLEQEAAEMAKKKNAREVALRQVRRMTTALLKDPVFKAIARGNPFKTKVNVAVSQLRASLKAVDIEVKVGI